MTLTERVNYYAKAVVALGGGLVAVAVTVIAATKDGSIDMGDLSVIGAAVVTLVTTVIAVIKKRNIDPSIVRE